MSSKPGLQGTTFTLNLSASMFGGSFYHEEVFRNIVRKELHKKKDDVFRHHDVSVEEYRALGAMINSSDSENLTVARALIEELYKRPRLYPQWSR